MYVDIAYLHSPHSNQSTLSMHVNLAHGPPAYIYVGLQIFILFVWIVDDEFHSQMQPSVVLVFLFTDQLHIHVHVCRWARFTGMKTA